MIEAWYAIQVRPRYEMISRQALEGKGYQVFLPTYQQRVPCKGAQSSSREEFLFRGYLFCRLMADSTGKMVTTPGVIRVLGCGGKATPIPDGEISDMQRLIQSGMPRQPWRYLPAGSMVRIEQGPLAGLTGILVSCEKDRRLVISVTLLQRSVAAVLEETTTLTRLGPVFRERSLDCQRVAR
jgi:transcriptional antiterminator RfaH